jgi:hypothetical protein
MKRVRRLWMPLLVGVLLTSTVVGVVGARPNARPQQQAWRVLTVPAQFCIPGEILDQWVLWTDSLRCMSGACHFMCPLNFPAAGEQAVGAVNVKRITLYVYDNWSGEVAAAQLFKLYPPMGVFAVMAEAESADLAVNPQAAMDTSIDSNPVYRTQGPAILLNVAGDNLRVYGIFVHYTW